MRAESQKIRIAIVHQVTPEVEPPRITAHFNRGFTVNVKHLGIALAASILVLPAAASAAPTQQLQINATVVKSCDFNPIPAIALGSYDWHTGISTTVSNELSVECNSGVVYSFSADRGVNSVGTQNNLANGSTMLAYSLLVNDGTASPFDPATNTGSGVTAETATGHIDQYALVLNVPAAQMVPAGAYSDTVTFSLAY
jgi:spore coat protein U-like protein